MVLKLLVDVSNVTQVKYANEFNHVSLELLRKWFPFGERDEMIGFIINNLLRQFYTVRDTHDTSLTWRAMPPSTAYRCSSEPDRNVIWPFWMCTTRFC